MRTRETALLLLTLLIAGAACAPAGVDEPAAHVDGLTASTPRWRSVEGRSIRRLTDAEAARLGAARPSWIVRDPGALSALAQGTTGTTLLVPVADDRGVVMPLGRVASIASPIPFVLRDGRGPNPSAKTRHPTFHEYLSPASALRDGGLLRVVVEAGAPGSLRADGALAAEGGRRVGVRIIGAADLAPGSGLAPGERAFLVAATALERDTRAAQQQCASGFGGCGAYCANVNSHASCDSELDEHPCCEPYDDGGPAIHHQCNDGQDDDGDGLIDAGDPDCQHSDHCAAPGMPPHLHTYEAGASVGLFGDIVLCTQLGDGWTTALWDSAAKLERIYHTRGGAPATGNAVYDAWTGFPGTNEPMRIGAIGCWRLADSETAKDCRDDGGAACAPFAPGATHEYPYAGDGSSLYAYAAHVADDVFHGVSQAGLGRPLNAAHVMVSPQSLDLDVTVGTSESTPGFGSAAFFLLDGGYDWIAGNSGHEIGHTIGLSHCHMQVVATLPDGTDRWSLMGTREPGGFCLDVEDDDQLSDQLGAIEAGALYEAFMEYFDDDGDPTTPPWHGIHRPSFGNH
jgi:hypothetical protein